MTSEKRPLDVQQEVARWRLLADVLDATPDWWTNHPCSKNEHDFIVTRVDRWERLSAYLEHTTAEVSERLTCTLANNISLSSC
jgi:hypothetical protein